VASATQAGFRGMLAPWIGGVASPPATGSAGYRGLLGIWLGGISAPAAAPTPPRSTSGGAGGRGGTWIEHARYYPRVYFNEYDPEFRRPEKRSRREYPAHQADGALPPGARTPKAARPAAPAYRPVYLPTPPGYLDALEARAQEYLAARAMELERQLRIEQDIVFVMMVLGANA
jgi:hypothetical protein